MSAAEISDNRCPDCNRPCIETRCDDCQLHHEMEEAGGPRSSESQFEGIHHGDARTVEVVWGPDVRLGCGWWWLPVLESATNDEAWCGPFATSRAAVENADIDGAGDEYPDRYADGIHEDPMNDDDDAEAGDLVPLDEIGTLKLEAQAKLLRVLESGEYSVVGESKTRHADVRVVAITNEDLATRVREGQFREDLYYRLNVLPIQVPPLADRKDDIPLLVKHFLESFRRKGRSRLREVEAAALAILDRYDWPGNVRELRNVLDRAIYIATASGEQNLELVDLPVTPGTTAGGDLSFVPGKSYRETRSRFEADFERRYVSWLLERHKGNISAAARDAKMDRKHLYDLARKHGLRGPSS